MVAIHPDRTTGQNQPAAGGDQVSARPRRRRLHATAHPDSITSDLGFDEPVTIAEIQLVLAALSGTMREILEPTRPACPTIAIPSDA